MGIIRTNIRQLIPTVVLGTGCTVLVSYYCSRKFSTAAAWTGGFVSACFSGSVLLRHIAYIYGKVIDGIDERIKQVTPANESTATQVANEVEAIPVES